MLLYYDRLHGYSISTSTIRRASTKKHGRRLRESSRSSWDILSNLALTDPALANARGGKDGQPVAHVHAVDFPQHLRGEIFLEVALVVLGIRPIGEVTQPLLELRDG